MRLPCTSRMRLPANPPISASRTLAASTPFLRAKVSASATPSIVTATTIWLQALATCPAPWSPTSTMFLPIASSSGLTRSNTAGLPPTMIDSVALIAPTSPPETGASSISMPRACSFSAMWRVAVGEIVLMSTTTEPGLAPSITPLSPNRTCSTSVVSDTMTMMISPCAAASAIDAHPAQPASSGGVMVSGRRPCTKTVCPALCRLMAMGLPMMPMPMNATFIVALPWPSVGLVLLVHDVGQPQADLRPQVEHRHRDDLDRHERQHAGEDLVQGHVRRRHALEVESGHCHRRRQERRLQVERHHQAEEQRVDVEVRQKRNEDRHEDDDDLGPLERPAEDEDDGLRQQHELGRRHVQREHPLLDDLLPAEQRERGREDRRADEQPAHHGRGLGGEEDRLLHRRQHAHLRHRQ